MTHDWLLVETLGTEPAVVAQGRKTKNLVPISAFLRRSPHLMAIQTAISETIRTCQSLSTITPRNDRVIRTETVQMSDGRIHGVQVWIGPPDVEAPERPVPGPLMWDLTNGVATDTRESLYNSGKDPSAEATHGRAFADDLPQRDLKPGETKLLSMIVKAEAGETLCDTWNLVDYDGEPISVGFVLRAMEETQEDGSIRLVCRGMNWRSEAEGATAPQDGNLAQRILNGLAQAGVHRAVVDPANWKLLRWLDEPAPFIDWHVSDSGEPAVNPADAHQLARMAIEYASGATSGIVRIRSADGGWTPVHMTVNRIRLDKDTHAGVVALRLPSEAELATLKFDNAADEEHQSVVKKLRKSRPRGDKAAKPT